MARRYKAEIIGFIIILSLLVLAYFPFLKIPFIFNDDSLIFSDHIDRCADHPQYYYFFLIGRPLYPFLACPFWLSIDNVNDLAWARFINILALSISTVILFKWFLKNHTSLLQSLLIAVIIFITPTFQTQVILANSFPHMIAVMFSIFSGILVCSWMENDNKFGLIPASVFLFLSLCIHPCVAMFVWPIICIFVYKHTVTHKLYLILFWFALICVIYFLFAKFMYVFCSGYFHVPADITCGHKVSLSFSPTQYLGKFYRLVITALHLWTIIPQNYIVFSVLTLMFTAAVMKIFQFIRNPRKDYALRFVILIFSIPLSILPILVADYSILSYRMISGLTAIIVIMTYMSLNEILKALPVKQFRKPIINLVLIAFTVVYIYQCQFNITHFLAVPAYKELQFIKSKLNNVDIKQIDTVHVLRPQYDNWFHRNLIGQDEFGFLSSSIPQNIRGIIRAAMIDLNFESTDIERIQIESSRSSEKGCFMDNGKTLIINMN